MICLTRRRTAAVVAVSSVLNDEGHFYSNRVLEQYTSIAPTKVTLRQLITFARNMNEAKLLRSANYVRSELPVRIAHRIRGFQSLPFIVGLNDHISFVYNLYWQAFERFRKLPPILTVQDNEAFCRVLTEALGQHLTVIPRLAQGFMECERLLDEAAVNAFMGEMLRSRIGRRVLAQQHLRLSAIFMENHAPAAASPSTSGLFNLADVINKRQRPPPPPRDVSVVTVAPESALPANDPPQYFGIVCSNTSAYHALRKATTVASALMHNTYNVSGPPVHIDGHTQARFTYIPDHIEYVLLEALKNAMKATIERCGRDQAAVNRRPLEITICEGADDVVFRISDQGDGIPATTLPHLFSFAHASKRHPTSATSNSADDVTSTTEYQNLSQLAFLAATIHEQQTDYMGRQSSSAASAGEQPPALDRYYGPAISPASPALNLSSMSSAITPVRPPARPFSHDMTFSTQLSLSALPTRPMVHLGLGSPMLKVYVDFWGGSVDLFSMNGYGTDVYIRVDKHGVQTENFGGIKVEA
ncbi:putative protein kinase [Sorochytrium milnesiophthora]